VNPSANSSPSPSTVEVGSHAEDLATEFLLEHGFEIVERNYKCLIGELDIIAIDGDVMVFVEVRSRASVAYGDAIETVNRRKQRKVTRVAEVFLQHKQQYASFPEYRFDVIAINGEREITHYPDAWRGGLL
jgi:putative endonuclease